jgi:hypothetical protein
MEVLKEQKGKHPHFVFAYGGNPINQCNNQSLKKAMKRVELKICAGTIYVILGNLAWTKWNLFARASTVRWVV